jgi:hypothetical protein
MKIWSGLDWLAQYSHAQDRFLRASHELVFHNNREFIDQLTIKKLALELTCTYVCIQINLEKVTCSNSGAHSLDTLIHFASTNS